MTEELCRICKHPKSQHHSHVAPDHTGQNIRHVGCMVVIKTDIITDFLGKGNDMPIGHTCSCDGFKPNTKLKRAIKKYQTYLRGLPKTVDNMYKRKEIEKVIRRFKKSIKENPKNLLHWQKEELKV